MISGTQRYVGKHSARRRDELSGIVMMLGLIAVLCVLAAIFV